MVKPNRGEVRFTLLEHEKLSLRSVIASIAAHIAMLTAAIVLPMFFIVPVKLRPYALTLLTPPPLRPSKPQITEWKTREVLKRKQVIIAPPPVKTAEVVRPPKPVPEIRPPEVRVEPKPAPAATATLKTETPKFESRVPERVPTPEVRPKVVQTGGFGDTNGTTREGQPNKPGNIASIGSFDLPAGDGVGNGRGGAKGERTVVMGSGFDGAGAGASGGSGSRPRGVVAQSGFGNVEYAAAESRPRESKPVEVPVEITYKPRPEYTEDARRMRIEGEVALRVVFTALGRIRVLNLVRGLGHGLDEKAIQAAERIQFKPALSDGAPVDSTATVRIAFQLAYEEIRGQ